MYYEKLIPTKGTGTTMGQTTINESLYTSHDHWQSMSQKGTKPPHGNGLLVHDANIQPGQHNTRTTSQSRSHGQKVQLPLRKHKPKNSGDQPTPHLQAHVWHL
ncbi:hypothetical protein Taro_001875 [Colocasia esculenta]|uniref:Uncharacterized protein n=1 Tax=Colocasia esculenta TaxID=4460 RepID=A0A843TH69_COLES|nr:hypothetical protein [Colocasia esculenta]